MVELLYLDLCCFKRPFDDPRATRVRREAEAVAEILEQVEEGRFRLVRSFAHEFENERNPREDRRLATALWLEVAAVSVTTSEVIEERARALSTFGLGPLDALHIAFAEAARATFFLTTDDRLLARAARARLQVPVLTPDRFLANLEGGLQ